MNTNAVPHEAVAIYNRALELSNRGDLQNAIEVYRQAISICPTFIEAHNNIGEIYSRTGDSDKAISSYKEALTIKKNSRVLLNIGVEYYKKEEYKIAFNFFKDSLSMNPDFLEANFYSAMVLYNLEKLKEAEVYFSKVVSIDKKHLKANYILSFIYYQWQDYKRTIQCLDNIKDTADDIQFMNKYYGFCYFHLGHYDMAVSHLNTALESTPHYTKFKEYLQSVNFENKLQEIGDIETAIAELEKKIMNEEHNDQEIKKLGMLYIFNGKNSKAEKLLQDLKDKMVS